MENNLLEKYWNGETSPEEEAQLMKDVVVVESCLLSCINFTERRPSEVASRNHRSNSKKTALEEKIPARKLPNMITSPCLLTCAVLFIPVREKKEME